MNMNWARSEGIVMECSKTQTRTTNRGNEGFSFSPPYNTSVLTHIGNSFLSVQYYKTINRHTDCCSLDVKLLIARQNCKHSCTGMKKTLTPLWVRQPSRQVKGSLSSVWRFVMICYDSQGPPPAGKMGINSISWPQRHSTFDENSMT